MDIRMKQEYEEKKRNIEKVKDKALNIYTKMSIVLLVCILLTGGAFLIDKGAAWLNASKGILSGTSAVLDLLITITFLIVVLFTSTIIYINLIVMERLEEELEELRKNTVDGMEKHIVDKITKEASDEMELENKQREEQEVKSLSEFEEELDHE